MCYVRRNKERNLIAGKNNLAMVWLFILCQVRSLVVPACIVLRANFLFKACYCFKELLISCIVMAMNRTFSEGDLVWAKRKQEPYWPGKLLEKITNKRKSRPGQQLVYFFAKNESVWISEEFIQLHNKKMLDKFSTNSSTKSELFQAAVKEIVSQKKISIQQKAKESRLRRKEAKENTEESKQFSSQPSTSQAGNTSFSLLHLQQSLPSVSSKEENPQKEVRIVKQPIRKKKLGFLGLGKMGAAMAKNCLKAGYHVTVWNRTSEKCNALVNAGAIKASTIADVVISAEIIICCVADERAVTSVIFSENGVLEGLDKSQSRKKNFVQMSAVLPHKSIHFCESIKKKGGLYLGVSLIGSVIDAEMGRLLLVSSGEVCVFTDCENVFKVIGRHAYFANCAVGQSCAYGILYNAYRAVICAAMAESFALADECNVDEGKLKDTFEPNGLTLHDMHIKAEAMVNKDYSPQTTIEHQRKSMRLALRMSDEVKLPMQVTTAAHQVYKQAAACGYDKEDVAAVHKALKE